MNYCNNKKNNLSLRLSNNSNIRKNAWIHKRNNEINSLELHSRISENPYIRKIAWSRKHLRDEKLKQIIEENYNNSCKYKKNYNNIKKNLHKFYEKIKYKINSHYENRLIKKNRLSIQELIRP
tara:strand:+ start:181 stop:549 length:369 start_codon:yes stop_codon:yes gene_type:complete